MTDVMVVGGDVVGLATALGLARSGAEVTVVDPGGSTTEWGSGVLPWPALPTLDRLSVLPDLLAAGQRNQLRGLRVLRTGEHFDLELSVLGGVVPHPYDLHLADEAVRVILRAHLDRHCVAVLRPVQLLGLHQSADSVEIELRHDGAQSRLSAPWLVAADGTNSWVRRMVGVGFPGTTWQERSVVAWVDHDFSELGYAPTTLQVDPVLGALVQRAHDGLWRYAFAEPLALAENGLAERVERVLGQVAPEAGHNVVSFTAGRMHERTVDSYRLGRVLLAGDAAHATNLLSGAGLVAGLLDAEALVSALSEEATDAALDAYAEVRRRDFLDRVLPASSDLKHLVTQITDRRRLDTELEQYRHAVHDLDAQRELLLFGQASASLTHNRSQRGTS